MKVSWIGSAFLCSALAFACGGGSGGGSGVDEGKLVVDLTPAEAADVCEFIMSQAPAFHTIDCGGGQTTTIGFEDQAAEDAAIADCTNQFSMAGTQVPDCTATVGVLEDCFIALSSQSDAELCGDGTPPECDALFNDPACN